MVTVATAESLPPGQGTDSGAVTVELATRIPVADASPAAQSRNYVSLGGQGTDSGAATGELATPPPVADASPAAHSRTYVSPGDLQVNRENHGLLDGSGLKRGLSLTCSLVQSGAAVVEFVFLGIQLGRVWSKIGSVPYCEKGGTFGNALGMGSDWTKAGLIIVLMYCGYLVLNFAILVIFKSCQVSYIGGSALMQVFRDNNLLCSLKLNLLATDIIIFLHFHQAIGFLSFVAASDFAGDRGCLDRGPMSWLSPKINEALPLCLLFLVILRVLLEGCYYEQSMSGPGYQDVQRTTCCCIRTRVVTTADGQIVQQSPVTLILGYLDWMLHLWGFFFALTVAVGTNPYRITYMSGLAATLIGGLIIAVF